MRRQFSHKLIECNVGMQQSIAYFEDQTDLSIIHQLNDFQTETQIESDYLMPELDKNLNHQIRPRKKSNILEEMRFQSISPKEKLKPHYAHEEAEKEIEKLVGQRTKAKIDMWQRSRLGGLGSTTAHHIPPRTNKMITQNEIKQRRLTMVDRPFIETKQQKEKDNLAIRIKADHNRSSIIKNKEVIEKLLSQHCVHCGDPILDVLKNGLICSNIKCPSAKNYEPIKTFPLIGILYDMEIPASSIDDLGQLVKRIVEELQKTEEWMKSLLNLQLQIEKIIENRKQSDRESRFEIREFTNSLNNIKKSKNQSQDLSSLKYTLSNIQFNKNYEEFSKWSDLHAKDYQSCRQISEYLEKCKPLCLKQVCPKNFKQIADVTNNFKNTVVKVNVSSTIMHNFSGRISKLIISMDGSIELKQNCFLLVDEIDEMVIEFVTKKTSRQLRQILHILPCANTLRMQFDFKVHSHVSSEAFPMLSKFCEKGLKQIHMNFTNARPELIEDLLATSRSIGQKNRANIKIQMNPYVGMTQIPQNLKTKEWGAMVLKNMLRNIGPNATQIKLNLPIFVDHEEICEFVLNNDYSNLIEWELSSFPSTSMGGKSTQKLLNEIVNNRKMMISHIVSLEKNQEHVLHCHPESKSAIFQMIV